MKTTSFLNKHNKQKLCLGIVSCHTLWILAALRQGLVSYIPHQSPKAARVLPLS